MFRRETLIALRARHEAYRIATDILYPHEDPPPRPQPVVPFAIPQYPHPVRRRPSRQRMIAWAILIWSLVLLVLANTFLAR
jgi:hypothetical protein